MQFSDSHIHLAEISHFIVKENDDIFLPICASAHTKSNFERMQHIADENNCRDQIFFTFGLHPQCFAEFSNMENPVKRADFFQNSLIFLENLAKNRQIAAIGECGFDAFNKEFRDTIEIQEKYFRMQLEIAAFYDIPVVIHCRKALDRLFAACNMLKKLPAVIFHSWTGSANEANSFLKRGINAYFCIGKQVLNGNKHVLECASSISIQNLLCETDAPYQKLKNEAETSNKQIKIIHNKVASLRKTETAEIASICLCNFLAAFKKH